MAKSNIIRALLTIVRKITVFIVLLMVAFHLSPYLLGTEHYVETTSSSDIHSYFPIALMQERENDHARQEERVHVLTWGDYQQAPGNYTAQLLQVPQAGTYRLANNEQLVLAYVKQNGSEQASAYVYMVRHETEDYTFWSEYRITQDGRVVPILFRLSGAMLMMPAFFAVWLVYTLLKKGLLWWWRRRLKHSYEVQSDA